MNIKKELEEITFLEKSGKIEEVITLYEQAGLFGVAGMFAEKIGKIEKAMIYYEKAGDYGLADELKHGRRNPEYVKKIEDGGVNFVLEEIKKNEFRARTGYYDGEMEWGAEQWKREAEKLKEGFRRLEELMCKSMQPEISPKDTLLENDLPNKKEELKEILRRLDGLESLTELREQQEIINARIKLLEEYVLNQSKENKEEPKHKIGIDYFGEDWHWENPFSVFYKNARKYDARFDEILYDDGVEGHWPTSR